MLTSIDTGRRILVKGGSGLSKAPLINEWLTSAAVLVAVVLPWVIGGWVPPPSAFIPSLLLVLAAGFASTVALVMAEFDATMGMTESLTKSRSSRVDDIQVTSPAGHALTRDGGWRFRSYRPTAMSVKREK